MTDMRKNEYSIEVIAKFYNDENTAMMIFCEKPFHFDGDDKTYYWHLECMYSHNEVIMYFLVYDEENKTYVTEKVINISSYNSFGFSLYGLYNINVS